MTVIGTARPLAGPLGIPGTRRVPAARPGRPTRARPAPARQTPAAPASMAVLTRRRLSVPARAHRRASPIGVLLATVLVALLLGLIYLAQTVQLAATNYQTEQLVAQRDDLYRQVQTVETSILHWGTEATVLDRAQHAGLDQLATRVRLPVR